MSRLFGRIGGVLLSAALAGAALAAPAPPPPEEGEVKERKEFIPNHKYHSLSGTTIGVLVSDVTAMMGQDGRSGPPDAYAFSTAGGSYRWVYTPTNGAALISNLQVKVGEKGDNIVVYPALNMANAETVKQWNIKAPYALVEVDVNDAKGAPADESFVGTRMKRIDDTKEYPLLVPEVIASLRDRYTAHVKDMKKSIDDALTVQAKDVKMTGPRETADLMYVTWLPETERLCVRFRTTLTDGAYQYGNGVNPDPRVPPFVQPKDIIKDKVPEGTPTTTVKDATRVPVKDTVLAPPNPIRDTVKDVVVRDTVKDVIRDGRGKDLVKDLVFAKDFPAKDAPLRVPPQPGFGARFGVQVGVEFGVSYEVSKTGKLVRIDTLPIEGFRRELPPPPAVGPLNPRDPLPPVRVKD